MKDVLGCSVGDKVVIYGAEHLGKVIGVYLDEQIPHYKIEGADGQRYDFDLYGNAIDFEGEETGLKAVKAQG